MNDKLIRVQLANNIIGYNFTLVRFLR